MRMKILLAFLAGSYLKAHGSKICRLSPWAKWLKMADRYHLRWQRLSYIKLKLIMSSIKNKYMIAPLKWWLMAVT